MQAQREHLVTLYRDHRSWLHGWLSGRVGCRETASDLTQDTFIRLLQDRDLAALPEGVVPSLEDQALVREALQQIDAMLDGLPVAARQVFLLAQFEGLRYEAIAQRLHLSLSTVKRHMKRALVGCLAHAG